MNDFISCLYNSISFSYNLLKNVPLSELKTLRVAVKRNNITTSAPPGPLERGIDDPRSILPCVHYRKGIHSAYYISFFLSIVE